MWPSLTDFHIVTGFEMSTGKYSMRGADRSFPRPPIHEEADHEWSSDSDDWDEEDRLEHEHGNTPIYGFRIRPEVAYFDTLAISIARAAICMPKLNALSLEILSRHCESNTPGGYHGWGFHFRSGNDARNGRDTLPEAYEWLGIDSNSLERPRTEWVFECPHAQVQWEEPEAAKVLWREKFEIIDFDVMTLEFDKTCKSINWARRRNGMVLDTEGIAP
jgi:hypothetical protein